MPDCRKSVKIRISQEWSSTRKNWENWRIQSAHTGGCARSFYKKRLGKGCDSIVNYDTEEEAVTDVRLSEIRKNPYQPRVEFDQEKLGELADSIGTHGVLQPIILRKSVKGYDIVVGERRFRASK